MKELKSYASQVFDNRNNPAELSRIYIALGARYAYEAEQRHYGRIRRAQFWQDHKVDTQGKAKSDTKIEMEWILTDEGTEYDKIKTDMDAIDKLMKALTSVSIQISREVKNET